LDVTPNIDALARQSRWFVHAHVAAAICQPSRQAMMTGRYPHNNGAPGFHPIDPSIPTLQAHLREAGFINGILGKVDHLAPQQKYRWEHVREMSELGQGRDPGKYYRFAAEFLDRARSGRRPFFFMANSHDPHRPFAGSDQEKHTRLRETGDGYPDPSRIYHPGEIQVPGFLPNLPEVRREVAEYLSSCRRADDTVGAILKALDESGEAKNTIIIFLSDNGMAFPYAKANCYLSSTRTPLLVRWPGRVTPGVDRTHFICGVDFMPTILEIMRLPQPGDMDGTSFLPLLCGESQSGRESVFTTINTLASARAFPMRCLQNHRYGYIFNAWSDGQTERVADRKNLGGHAAGERV